MNNKQSMMICFGIAFAFLILTVGTVTADTIEVPSVQGPTIQGAIYNATDGDIILVYPGTYEENVDVNKELIITAESGDPASTVVKTADSNGHVFYVTADNVDISGFNIVGTTESFNSGIYLRGVEGCTIANNIISNNNNGIALWASNDSILSDNSVSNNNISIYLYDSDNNMLSNNTANSNDYNGIVLSSSNDNILSGNAANSNIGDGIVLVLSSDNTLGNNNVLNNHYGILLSSSSSNTLSDNTANSNDYNGIHMVNSNDNTLTSNTVSSNKYNGLYLSNSDDNLIYNNYFSNINNVRLYGTNTGNIWNTIKTAGANIVGGPFLGGNYWSDYIDIDVNKDGICDSPNYIDEDDIDHLPLYLASTERIENLRAYVTGLENLNNGGENSLDKRLGNAQSKLEEGKDDVAVTMLGNIINNDQNGNIAWVKQLSPEQAEYIINEIERIIDLIQG